MKVCVLGAGVAVLLSSHLLDRVQSVCDRVALFNKGKIALMGTVVELANQVLGAGHPLLVEATGATADSMFACTAFLTKQKSRLVSPSPLMKTGSFFSSEATHLGMTAA